LLSTERNHVLCQEGQPVDRFILIKSGWVATRSSIPSNAADSGIAMGWAESSAWIFSAPETAWPEGTKAKAIEVQRLQQWLALKCSKYDRALAADPLAAQMSRPFSGFSSADDKLPPTIGKSA